MFYMDIVAQRGTPQQQAMAKQADTLTKERLCMGLSMFQRVLQKVKELLVEGDRGQNVWFGPPPANGVMDIDECNQFHRLWSAVTYTINVTASMRGVDQTLCVL
jgi:cytoplasmic FMR1 interacting protein